MTFLLRIVFSVRFIATRNLQHAVSDKVLTRSVALNNCFDDVFRNICIVGQQLLRILRQAIAAIAKALVEEPSLLCCSISVQLVEIGNAQCQISVAEQLNSLCFGEAHEQRINVLFNRALLQQSSEGSSLCHHSSMQ